MKMVQFIIKWMTSKKLIEGFLRKGKKHSIKDLSREKLNY